MAIKFSQFNTKTTSADVQFIVGYNGLENVKITPTNFLGAVSSLDFIGDAGTGSVNLAIQSFSIVGTASEIETSASAQTLTIGLPDDVTIGNNLTVTGSITQNSNTVTNTFNGDVAVSGTNKYLKIGASNELLLYHHGTDGYITNNTGDLKIISLIADKDVIISADNGSGGATTPYIVADGSLGQVQLNYYGAIKLNTINTGVSITGNAEVSGTVAFGTLQDTGESINISKFVDEADGIPANDNDTSIPTSAAVKDYVDSQVTAQDLDIQGDTGTGSVDLDSQALTIAGTANQTTTVASGQTITIGLPSSVVITGTYFGTTFDGQLDGTISSATTAVTQLAGDNSTKVATTAYVDSQVTAQDLDFTGDSGTGQVDLDSQALSITGGAVITTTALNQNLDIVHDNVSRTDTTSSSSPAFGGTFTAVDSVTSSTEGHITAINLKTVTVPTPTYPTVNNNTITISAGSNLNGGGDFTLNQSFDETITVNLDTTITGLTSVTSTTFVGALQGNADTATALAASGNITLTGDTTSTGGPYTYTSGGNVAISTTIADTTVTGKLITGVNLGTAQNIAATDTILEAFGYLQAQITQLPQGLVYNGTWNASTNTPTLTSGSGTTGHFYIVSVAGSTNLDGITDWQVGDWAIFVEAGGTDTWQKIDNTSAITGTGATNKLAKWTGPTTLSTGLVEDDGTTVTIGNSGDLDVTGDADVTGDLAWSTSLTDSTNLITITKFVDEADGIPTNDNDTSIPTSAAVKDYVDSQIGANDTLAEILANGNTTGGTDIAVSTGDDITFADSSKSIYGAGSDLQIYHDGSNSYINDTGTGLLKILTNGLEIKNPADNGYMAFFGATGASELYFNTAKKFETTSTGVSVTGDVVSSAIVQAKGFRTETGSTDYSLLTRNSSNTAVYIQQAGTGNILDVRYGSQAAGQGTSAMSVSSSGNTTFTGNIDIFGNNKHIRFVDTYGNWLIEAGDGANNFKIHSQSLAADYLTLEGGGQLNLGEYGSGTFTGTATYRLAVDSSGDVIEIPIGGGPVDGSGTAGRVTKWIDTDTIGNSGIVDSSNAVAMTINGNEEIGIGTSSPFVKLHVETTASAIARFSYNSTNYQDLTYEGSNIVGGSHVFKVGGTERMRIDSSGDTTHIASYGGGTFPFRVGYGSYSSFTPTFVIDDGGITTITAEGYQLAIEDLSSGNISEILTSNTAMGFFADRANAVAGTSMIFSIDNSTKMTIDSSGNVGIGTTSPTTFSGYTTVAINNATQGGILELQSNGTSSLRLACSIADSALWEPRNVPVLFGTNNTERMRITSGGYILTGGRTSVTGNWGAGSIEAERAVGAFNSNKTIYLFNNGSTVKLDAYDYGASSPLDITIGGNGGDIILDGDVGIGTTAPTAKLEIVGSNGTNIFRGNFGGSADIFMGFDNANPYLTLQDNSNVTTHLFQSNVNNYIVGSNVGIGTSSPSKELDVVGTIKATGADNSNTMEVFGGTTTNQSFGLLVDAGTSATDYAARFRKSDNTVIMEVSGDGNVGIGTTSPTADLSVGSTSTSSGDVHLRTTKTTFSMTPSNTDAGGILLDVGWVSGGQGPLKFGIGGSEKMRIDSSGSVGIGTTSPSQTLEVFGSIYSSGVGSTLLFDTTGALSSNGIKTINDYETLIYNGRGAAGFAVIGNSSIRLGFGTNYTNAETDLYINTSGQVGIGTTSPSYKLQVNGNAYINSTLYVNGATTVDDNFYVTNGNVGIGTTSPGNTLDVAGDTDITGQLVVSHNANYVAKFVNTATSMSNDNYALMVNSSSHTSNMTAAGAMSVDVNSGRAFTINGIGRVSIGGNTQSANNLTLIGTATEMDITNTSSNGRSYRIESDSAGLFVIKDRTANADRIVLNSSGNVGIGTTSPNDGDLTINAPKLHVVGPSTAGVYNLAARFQGGNDSDNTGSAILINHSNDRGLLIKAGRKDGDREVAYFDVISSGGNITNMLTMGKFGSDYNVGIGTTSPVVKLNVVGSAYFSGNDAWNGGGSEGNKTDIALVIDEGDTIYTRDSGQYLRTLIKKDTGDNIQIGEAGTSLIDNINFFSGSSCSYTWYNNSSAAMKLTSTGLGIGKTSPSQKLDVEGSIRLNSELQIFTGTTDIGQISNSGGALNIQGTSTRDVSLGSDSYPQAVFIEGSNGNVGIGLTNPDAKLEVTGGGSAYTFRGVYSGTSGSYAAGAFQLTGGSTSPSLIDFIYSTTFVGQIVTTGSGVLYQSNSDYRLKENVVQMTGALDRVNQLNPSRFNFIGHEETVDGFLAHELQQVVPQAVTGEKDATKEDGTPKYQGVDHSQIVPLLVGAIKELKAEIETLKAQINN